MNELQILNVQGIDCYEQDGTVFLKLEHVARGLGFTETAASGNECVRWRTVRKYLADLGVATSCDGDKLPDFIPENIFYRLAMKAKNEAAETFQAKIADEVIPSIRRTGAYLTPAAEARMSALEQRMNDLTAVNDLLLDLDTRLLQMERRIDRISGPTGLMSITDIRPAVSPVFERENFIPGLAARKRWMRTASEKLDLMSARFNTTHNEILHSLYQHLEKRCGVVLEEEKLRVMEDHDLTDCSVLTAIFYNPELRHAFEENIDYNLAPENRGW